MGTDEAVARLRRWEDSGAVWRVLSRTDDALVISLLTCSAGEEVDRLRSSDPDLLDFVGRRAGSDDPTDGIMAR
jgi:hypothetical protein